MNQYTLGTLVTVEIAFDVQTGVDSNGDPVFTPADPTEIMLTVKSPAGVMTQYTYPEIPVIKDSVGRYHADILPTAEGDWQWRFVGTGAAQGASEGEFRITSLLSGPTAFLQAPDDYDGIRYLLGVEIIDLPDAVIESSMFAGQAETMIKARVEDWSTLLADPEGKNRLRTVAGYMTAALIAETMAKGGFIGLTTEANRDDRDWQALADLLWARYREWLDVILRIDEPPPDDYALPMMRVTGPSRVGLRGEGAPHPIPPWASGYPASWGGWSD